LKPKPDKGPAPDTTLAEADHEILKALFDDSRMSFADTGRLVNMSRASVREHTKRMIDEGIIERFTAILNPTKLGYPVSAFFEINVQPGDLHSQGELLAANPCVANIYQMTGPSTLHMHALLQSPNRLDRFILETLHAMPGFPEG
jgi:DNA-binding Lrp family transcriptional regulator